MEDVFLSLGGNEPETPTAFLKAFNEIQEHIGALRGISSVYITEPLVSEGVDPLSIAPYYNLALKIVSTHSPHAVLASILNIEKKLGRVRDPKNRYAPRMIDIDIIVWGDLCLEDNNLTIPHPEMHKRDFVLQPLLDIDPTLIHPLSQQPLKKILNDLSKKFIIKKV